MNCQDKSWHGEGSTILMISVMVIKIPSLSTPLHHCLMTFQRPSVTHTKPVTSQLYRTMKVYRCAIYIAVYYPWSSIWASR